MAQKCRFSQDASDDPTLQTYVNWNSECDNHIVSHRDPYIVTYNICSVCPEAPKYVPKLDSDLQRLSHCYRYWFRGDSSLCPCVGSAASVPGGLTLSFAGFHSCRWLQDFDGRMYVPGANAGNPTTSVDTGTMSYDWFEW